MPAPNSFSSGDSATWTERLPDHPASAGWSLLLRFLWPTLAPFEVKAAPDGDDFLITLTPEDTATWPAGPVTVARIVRQPGISKTLVRTYIEILPNLSTAAHFDPRSPARQTRDALKEALRLFVQGGKWKTQSYSIAGRAMTFRSAKEIMDLIHYYEREVAKEIALAGGSQRIQMRF